MMSAVWIGQSFEELFRSPCFMLDCVWLCR